MDNDGAEVILQAIDEIKKAMLLLVQDVKERKAWLDPGPLPWKLKDTLSSP